MKPLALITAVGPGTGSSIARRFSAAGYRTALLARDESRLNALAAELPDALALPCDVTDPEALAAAVDKAGPAEVVVHNAVGGAWGTFREIDPAVLERNFQINVMGDLAMTFRNVHNWIMAVLEAASEINANPEDSKDHPKTISPLWLVR